MGIKVKGTKIDDKITVKSKKATVKWDGGSREYKIKKTGNKIYGGEGNDTLYGGTGNLSAGWLDGKLLA